jgi:hypothetical protein
LRADAAFMALNVSEAIKKHALSREMRGGIPLFHDPERL